MRVGRVRSRRACFSVCHPGRRFARVARSEVERPALLSVILSEVAAATESKDPYTAPPLSLRRFFDGAEVRAGCAKRSRRACFSVCHPEPRSPRRPSRRTPILPTHFRFAGFSTERRFVQVARSEVEEPAFLSVILSRGRRGDRVEGPLYCPLTFASQVFRRSGGSRRFHESEQSHFITFSLLSPPAEQTAEKLRAPM